MSKTWRFALLVCGALWAASPSTFADVWDLAEDGDDGITTDTILAHGVVQLHDLAAEGSPAVADQDWYVVVANGRSSYEVVMDNTTGDVNLTGGDLARIASNGSTVLQSSESVDGLNVLRWQNTTNTQEKNFTRVQGALCGTACTTTDQYGIRFYETTYSVPRFNNANGQFTVVVAASTSAAPCDASFNFYDGSGVLLGTEPRTFSGRVLHTFNTADLVFAAGKSGWITVTHTCGYGGLSGKAVALEPATGFTFDTPFIPRVL